MNFDRLISFIDDILCILRDIGSSMFPVSDLFSSLIK